MFSAFLAEPSAWKTVLTHPVWLESLKWLERETGSSPPGDYFLGKPGWLANVHSYDTQPVDKCIWESHEHTVDVQYMIEGVEEILWERVSALGEPIRSFNDRDRMEWNPPNGQASILQLRAGMFVIFLPGEGHCPMVALNEPAAIRKAVVKIPVKLLSEP